MRRRALTLVALAALLGVGVALVTSRPRPAPPDPSTGWVPRPLAALAEATAWLNTSEPVTPRSLEGQVTVVVFWAYSNAQVLRVLPVIKTWHQQYREHGLEVIGVHTPEFPFEASVADVQTAVERLAIPFPVAVDSDRRIWAAFRAHEWPSYYVADPDGALLGFQVGAGREPEVELYVRGLLAEQGEPSLPEPATRGLGLRSVLGDALRSSQQAVAGSPEMVFRLPLAGWFVGPQPPVGGQPRVYQAPEPLPVHAAALDGVWQFEEDRAVVIGPTGRLVVRYRASQCHLVVDGPPGQWLQVRVDGERRLVLLDQPRAYTVVAAASADAHTLDVTLPRGAALYACTFSE
ncbi:MAG: hypothetical protein A3C53_00715 [Omnitrophica WOR_2 bacterium RIFCSPHIGHO2_02_FULL_68_15]|nr:MAG: hypothetical protein A3C53_00715 [Omnitrophica WOR_2 bacterium RIFCSPHIGHO2_02_FULL_68_15]